MKFVKSPENYALMEEGLVYDIDLGSLRDSVEVSIVDADDNSVAARLRFAQTAFVSIDIAPYVRRMFAVKPEPGETGARVETGRTVSVAVEVDGTRSEVRKYTLFTVDGVPRLLTTMPMLRRLAAGQFDEIAFYAPDGLRIVVATEFEEGARVQRRSYTIPEKYRDLWVMRIAPETGATGCTVWFEWRDRTETVVYEVVQMPAEAVRVAWVASTGAVEYYTFPTLARETLNVEKSGFSGRRGRCTTDIEARKTMVAVSDCEPRAVVDALEEIISSPAVWMVRAEGPCGLQVLTSESSLRFDGSLNTVAIEFVAAKPWEELR